MRTVKLKIWLMSIGGAIVALFLFFFGLKFLFRPNDATDWQLFLLTIISVLSGVFTLAAQIFIPRKFMIGTTLILLGVYFALRATGAIHGAWLMRILGILSLLGASLIIYVTYLAENKIKS